MEKISVCLLTYNRASVLPQTLDTILNQTYTNFELIIGDNCSTDNTKEVCLSYLEKDNRIKYIRNETNLGLTGNLNVLIKNSTCELIANLFDGDLYDINLLKKWVTALTLNPKAAFVFNSYAEIDSNKNVIKIFEENLPDSFSGKFLLENLFYKRWHFDSPVFGTVLGKKSIYKKFNFFNNDFGFYADVDMWMRLCEEFDVCYIKEPLIFLPAKNLLPHQFNVSFIEEQKTLEKIFYNSRKRHYKSSSILLLYNLFQHSIFVFFARSYKYIVHQRRYLLNNLHK